MDIKTLTAATVYQLLTTENSARGCAMQAVDNNARNINLEEIRSAIDQSAKESPCLALVECILSELEALHGKISKDLDL